MKKVIDAVYNYLYDVTNPDDCKKRLDNVLDFVIRLRHSFVDNDKQRSTNDDINKQILQEAEQKGLTVKHVELK